MSYKHLFKRFIEADPERRHFAAHSHHLWPDVTFDAQSRCWNDAARLADHKWSHVFGQVLASAQRNIAFALGLRDPRTLAFAPNTHEFIVRLLSCFPGRRPIHVVTTGSEFHSFRRQSERMIEVGELAVTAVPTEPFDTFSKRLLATVRDQRELDLVFLSQVFFDSGFVVPDLDHVVKAIPDEVMIVIDGYHGWMALPTDLSAIADRAFYMSGSYKYAMAGEGMTFLHCPPGHGKHPVNTGWFATFDTLTTESPGGSTRYPESGARFLGATFEPVGAYRLNAVFEMLDANGLTIAGIHAHVRRLQTRFLDALEQGGGGGRRCPIGRDTLVLPDTAPDRGNFLAFRLSDAGEWHDRLADRGVVTDYRRDRLRIGFGIYHDDADVDDLAALIRSMS